MNDAKLTVTTEEGQKITIDVIDIFELEGYDKEFIIYSIGNDIYSSILVEDETTFTLKNIEDPNDMKIIKKHIEELVS